MIGASATSCNGRERPGSGGRHDYGNSSARRAPTAGTSEPPAALRERRSAMGIQAPPGQPTPVLRYLIALFEHGKLEALESLEPVHPVGAQWQRNPTEERKEENLECTEGLGDVVKPCSAARPRARRTRSTAVAEAAAERPPPSPRAGTCSTRARRRLARPAGSHQHRRDQARKA